MDKSLRRMLGRVGSWTYGIDTTDVEYIGYGTRKISWLAPVAPFVTHVRRPVVVLVLKDEVVVVREGRFWRSARLWDGPKNHVWVGPQRRYTGTFTFGRLTLHLPHPGKLRRALGRDPSGTE